MRVAFIAYCLLTLLFVGGCGAYLYNLEIAISGTFTWEPSAVAAIISLVGNCVLIGAVLDGSPGGGRRLQVLAVLYFVLQAIALFSNFSGRPSELPISVILLALLAKSATAWFVGQSFAGNGMSKTN